MHKGAQGIDAVVEKANSLQLDRAGSQCGWQVAADQAVQTEVPAWVH